MNYGNCPHCNETVYSSDERVSTGLGPAHYECHEKWQSECEREMAEYQASENLRAQKENKLLKRLERSLKPKLWSVIRLVFQEHRVNYIHIDTFDKVEGSKQLARDWFGESVALRNIYDDTSFCSYSDCYGGPIWIPIGKKRYLHMHISG